MADKYLPPRPAKLTATQRTEWRTLDLAWRQAEIALEEADGWRYDQAYERREAAWDSLVDWVEENDLNFTKYDARGPERINDESGAY